ncbi:hypothetical protein [Hufsiella ginkgonis]|uniref:N-acetylglucosamine kinase n=1 Tax=Hufsiella ginkgonis TaxID=2695274 RepID=A0A7K1XZ33_9SPHI|nr:hypothetical protein [Hufsiella ginkgonis]MXV16213.1 hypothetical protein [Hufsiella ginkgonis]
MIAVVYSGSRYANWKLADKGSIIAEFKTLGINPFFNDERFITQLLNKTNELVTYAERIKKIYFFGAGASSPDRKKIIATSFSNFFRYGKISVEHDLKAAALATCGDHEGVVGIIGSGSNVAYYNGRSVKENNNGLGYILSDEGSANWLGRRLLKSFLNHTLPEPLLNKFNKKFGLERKQILDKVYRQPQPVLFLTSFSEFFAENANDTYVKETVKEGFDLYFKNYVTPITETNPGAPLHFAGTIAFAFEPWLREVAGNYGLEIASVVKAPIFNVLTYYTNKNQ